MLRNLHKEDGSMLIVVVVIAVVGVIASIVTLAISNHSVKTSKNKRVNISLLNIAEAGLQDAIARITSGSETVDAGTWKEVVASTEFGGGTYAVSCSANALETLARLHSTATLEDDCMTLETEIELTQSIGHAWDFGIFAGGDLVINGNGTLKEGKLHSNRSFRCPGNLESDISPAPACTLTAIIKIEINGNVKVPGLLKAPDVRIDGNNEGNIDIVESSVDEIECPVPDFTRYRDIALDNNWKKNGRTYGDNIVWTNIPGGVVWFDGNVRFEGNVNISGLLISTGEIYIEGNVIVTEAPEGYSGIVSTSDDIVIQGNEGIEGLVHTPQDLNFQGNGAINGQIIVCGNINVCGNYGTIDYQFSDLGVAGGDISIEDISWREVACP